MNERISPKARENRASRAARRQGVVLVKSRRRDPNADDYGKYVLPDDRDHAKDLFESGEGLSLDAVEASLNWRDVFVVGPDIADRGTLEFPGDRLIVEYQGARLGWRAEVLNDGSPLDWALAGGPDDVESAVRQAQDWVRRLGRRI